MNQELSDRERNPRAGPTVENLAEIPKSSAQSDSQREPAMSAMPESSGDREPDKNAQSIKADTAKPPTAYEKLKASLLNHPLVAWTVMGVAIISGVGVLLDVYSKLDKLTEKTDALTVQTSFDAYQSPRFTSSTNNPGFYAGAADALILISSPAYAIYPAVIQDVTIDLVGFQVTPALNPKENPQIPYGSKDALVFRVELVPSGVQTAYWTFEDSTATVEPAGKPGIKPDGRLISAKAGEPLLIKGIFDAIKPGEYILKVGINLKIGSRSEQRPLGFIRVKR
jgi:hypothetical protein